MKPRTKKILLTAGLIGLGFVVGRFILPPPVTVREPQAGEEDLVKLARMARDTRRMCEDVKPLLMRLESSLADRYLSPQEGIAILGELRALM